jgi:hypothetical protein
MTHDAMDLVEISSGHIAGSRDMTADAAVMAQTEYTVFCISTPAHSIKPTPVLFAAGSVSLQPINKKQFSSQAKSSRAWTFRPLKRKRISTETSETKYPVTQRHIPGERKSHSYRCENLQTRNGFILFTSI